MTATPRYAVMHAWAQGPRGGRFPVYDQEARRVIVTYAYRRKADRDTALARAQERAAQLNGGDR